MNRFFEYPGQGAGTSVGIEAEACFWVTRPARDWRTLLASCQTLRFAAGEVALAADAPNRAVSIIVFGRFSDGGSSWGDGQVIGVSSFFSGRTVTCDITASVESEVVRLSRSALDVLAAREPELARAVIFELARVLAVTEQR